MWQVKSTQKHQSIPSQGFSLLENLVIIIIISVLSAIAGPNLITWKANYDVRSSIDQAAETFVYFQRESIRSTPADSQSPTASGCRFTISNTAYTGSGHTGVPGISSSNCPQGNFRFENDITVDSSTGATTFGSSIKFSAIGSIILSSSGRLVLGSPNATVKRCLQMSQPLGMIRTGTWNGTSCT